MWYSYENIDVIVKVMAVTVNTCGKQFVKKDVCDEVTIVVENSNNLLSCPFGQN